MKANFNRATHGIAPILFFIALSLGFKCPQVLAQNYGFGGQSSSGNSFNGGYSALNTKPQPYYSSARNNSSSLEQKLQAVENSNNVGWYQASPPATQAARASVQQLSPNNRSPIFPSVSKKEAMRIFFEGGTPNVQGAGSYGAFGSAAAPAPANNSAATSNAYSNYQKARNEETKSRNYANTARYDSNQWNRKNAASYAEYAANNAYYAAQRAESASYSGDSQAKSYASLARDCANRARANADRARYNADTIK
jgi:hypothetical protein